jgi:EAL domain-containing protein (putative c-di-GMP-specific phosphodiesterase class I)
LRKAGCDTIQGYHFGRPVQFSDFPAAMLQAVAASAKLTLTENTASSAVA